MTTPDSVEVKSAFRPAAWRALLIAAGLGVWASYLFVRQPLGLSAPVFILTCVAVLFGLAALERVSPAWRNVWLVVPLLYFSAMVAVRAEVFVTLLNLGAALLVLGLLAHLFVGGQLAAFGVFDYLARSFLTSLEVGLLRPVRVCLAAGREARRSSGVSARLLAVLRGFLLAGPVVAVFTALLASADAAFNQSILDVLKFFSLDNLPELFARLVFAGMAAWICLGALAYALRADDTFSQVYTAPAFDLARLGFTECAIVLGSVNLLFAAFVTVQVRYFFGGQSNINVAGFTYADYARRGFAELVCVALFTLVLGLVLQIVTRRRTPATVWGFNGLASVLVVLTGVILVSAFQRLMLYEEAYGFTSLRTYAHVFMAWVGVLLGIFLLTTVSNRPRLFLFGALLAGLGFVTTLDVLNPDAFIAQRNIARYQLIGKIDTPYLSRLSDDAVPYTLPLAVDVNLKDREVLGCRLNVRLNALEKEKAKAGWQGWHWSRQQAYTLLAARRDDLSKFELPDCQPARDFEP